MHSRRLGRTGRDVVIVGFGGIPVRDRARTEAVELVEAALDVGLQFFDTARSYGDSEHKIGEAIAKRPDLRSSIVLATKSMKRSKREMFRDIEDSLRATGCEYIDLYQAHGVDSDEALDEILSKDGALSALRRAQSLGFVLHVGVTGHNPRVLARAVSTEEFDTVQVPVNALDRMIFDTERTLIPLALQRNMGIIAMKPLAGGSLKPAQSALRYALSREVSVAIPGLGTKEQLGQALAVAREPSPLSDEELQALVESAKAAGPAACRQCGYCMPCPNGIDIREVLRLEAMSERYEQKTEASRAYREMSPNAAECLDCGKCEERCPYRLNIRAKLRNAHQVLT